MKLRNGFVSNSSSSSFLIKGEVDSTTWAIINSTIDSINERGESENGIRVEETDDGIYITADYDVIEDIDSVLQRCDVDGEWSC